MSTLNSSKYDCTIYFVNELHSRYTCGICLNVADEPVNCGSKDGCTGIFCMKCLSTSLLSNKCCPLCKFVIAGPPTKNNLIKEIIYDELVYCMFSELTDDENPSKRAKTSSSSSTPFPVGCVWTGALKNLEAHLAHDCDLAPTSCTHKGCPVVIPRHQMVHHTEDECQFRKVACPRCDSALSFSHMHAHTAECGQVTVTCPHCAASFLRESQDEHDLICLEKPVVCPFAPHGCTAVLRRMEYDQHQIDSAVAHTELVATEVNSLKNELKSVNATISHLLHQDQTVVNWRVDDVLELIESGDEVNSSIFKLRTNEGSTAIYLHCLLNRRGKLEVYLFKNVAESGYKESIDITGTTLTLQHPTDPSLHITHTCHQGLIDAPHWNEGWDNIISDITPYISLNDTISLRCHVRYRIIRAEVSLETEG